MLLQDICLFLNKQVAPRLDQTFLVGGPIQAHTHTLQSQAAASNNYSHQANKA